VKRQWRQLAVVAAACATLVAILSVSGCCTVCKKRPEPVTVGQMIQMSKEGVPGQEIIRKMQASGTVYRLEASQLAKLREQGVPDNVIDYMQQTYIQAVRAHQELSDLRYWTWSDEFWYGGMPYGWPGSYYGDFWVAPHREAHEAGFREAQEHHGLTASASSMSHRSRR
jgi:hypothetical protein